MSRVPHAASLAAALLAVVAYAGTAHAEVMKCQQTLAKESSKFLQAKNKAMQKCYDAKVKNGSGTCPDQKASDSIAKAASKLSSGIGKACGGDDKVCGGDLTNEDTQDSVFPEQCPNLERGSCNNDMGKGCVGIDTCLECMGEAVVDQVMNLYYGDLALPSTDDLNKCQKAIGKETSKFLNSKSKALQKCWDGYLGVKHTNPCTPPGVGDGKYLASIQKAESKKISAICKACGGADKACDADINAGLIVSGGAVVAGTGGSDDLTPSAIGFATSCQDAALPYAPGTHCASLDDIDGAAGVIDSLRELILCADCITEFKADCLDAAQVPMSVPYPAECNACTTGAPTGPCPTTLEVTANGTDADLDTGWKGVAHDQIIPTNGRITLNVGGCAGTNYPTCGTCSVTGPIVNSGGPQFQNQRCSQAPWIQCTDDTQCQGTCAYGGVCSGGRHNSCSTSAECKFCISDDTFVDGDPCAQNQDCPGGYCWDGGPCLGRCSGGTNTGERCSTLVDCPDQGGGAACIPPNNGESCAQLSDCPNTFSGSQCDAGTCEFFYGAPLSLSAGNVPVCVFNQVDGPVSGTMNLDTGESRTEVNLLSRVHVVGTVEEPCPNCKNGVCDGGARQGFPCTVNGSNIYGPVSLDCPPVAGSNTGNLKITLQNDTGTVTKTLSTSNPKCRNTGYTSDYCFCDTCNNINAEACSSNADCPDSPLGTPGICGGKRCLSGTNQSNPCKLDYDCGPARLCYGGANNGAACTINTECPSGICGGVCLNGPYAGSPCRTGGGGGQCGSTCVGGPNHGATCVARSQCPAGSCTENLCSGNCGHPGGQPTQPNECTAPDGAPDGCQPLGDGEGECVDGPVNGRCSQEYYRECNNDVDCACSTCLPNQTCVFTLRECYTDNGVVGGSASVTGAADPPCAGTYAAPRLGSMFCVAPTGSSAVNAAGGLPGLGRLSLPVHAVLN